MIINSTDTSAILEVAKMENFSGAIAFDDGGFKKTNSLPDNSKYHTFLLDGENKVVVIGNPSENPKIYKLFMQEMTKLVDKPKDLPENLCSHPVIPLGSVSGGDTIQKSFVLINPTSSPYIIEGIVPSCACMKVVSSSDTILPGNTSEINMTFCGDTVVRPFRYQASVFLKEFKDPYILTVYGHTY